MGSLVVLLLAERARSEGARSTRALEDRPAYPGRKKRASMEGLLDGPGEMLADTTGLSHVRCTGFPGLLMGSCRVHVSHT